MKTYLLLTLTLAYFSCGLNSLPEPSMKNNSQVGDYVFTSEKQDVIFNGVQIDPELLNGIQEMLDKKAKAFHREIWKIDRDGNEEEYSIDTGIVFNFVEESTAIAIFNKYHKQVQNGYNYLFLTHLDFDEKWNSYYDIVIINRDGPYQIIELLGTHGINYDIYNDDVVKQMKEWDAKVDFEIQVIDESRIQAHFHKPPKDLLAWCKEIYEFCPDVIDQGYGDMEEMIRDYGQNQMFWLWWD